MGGLVERLVEAVGDERRDAGIAVHAVYQPVGGVGGKVMPPTYPINDVEARAAQRDGRLQRPYLFEQRVLDGKLTDTVIIDQTPSQANRIEQALLAARDAGRVDLPLFEMVLKDEGVRLTSLDFPHRYADAYLRDSQIGGVRFDKTAPGQALRAVRQSDVRALYRREPYSLIFGAWDSHRAGRGMKIPRVYSSSMFGTEYAVGDRRAGRFDPTNLSGAIDDKGNAENGWRFLPEGVKAKGSKLSEIGHGHIAPNAGKDGRTAYGGVTVGEIQRRAWISLAGLELLRFGDASPESATLARATLAALALLGDRLAFGRPSVWLRSGCDLTRVREEVFFERDGGGREPLDVSTADVLAAFVELRRRAAETGVAMDCDAIAVEPQPQLAEAIRAALRSTATEE